MLRRPASASWVLREAKQVAPTTRLAGYEPSKSRCAPPGSRSAPPHQFDHPHQHRFRAERTTPEEEMKKNRNGNVIVLGIGLISLLILVGCAHSQITHSQLSKDDPSFSGADDFNKWVQNYYKNPAPELFYASMDYVNLNINKPDYHPLLMSFYGELFKKHPEKTIAWVSR